MNEGELLSTVSLAEYGAERCIVTQDVLEMILTHTKYRSKTEVC